MADPGKCVALNQGHGGEPPFLGYGRSDEQCERNAGSRKVQTARSAVRVLAQIERIEVAKSAKSFFVVHGIAMRLWPVSASLLRQPGFYPIEPIPVKVLSGERHAGRGKFHYIFIGCVEFG